MDVVKINEENLNQKNIQRKLQQWDSKLAPLTPEQLDIVCTINSIGNPESSSKKSEESQDTSRSSQEDDAYTQIVVNNRSIETLQEFFEFYNVAEMEMDGLEDQVYLDYYEQLKERMNECNKLLAETDSCLDTCEKLTSEYNFVSNKTSALHTASEKLLQDQNKLNELANEIKKRLNYFTRVENIHQRLQNPTFSVAGDTFIEILNQIDESLEYIRVHSKFRETLTYNVKFKQCLSKAIQMMKTYVVQALTTATEQVLSPKLSAELSIDDNSPDIVFALYYGKFQASGIKVKRITGLIEERINSSYLEGICTILYDTLRPCIIHINHLETLAEICSILRIEMIEEHVQNDPESLEAFGKIINQLLQDVQERLVFRAHLYLQSDILNYNPSPGDLAYPDKLEMMESIALSLQENQLRRSDSRNSIVSQTSIGDSASVAAEQQYKSRTGNSPADLHGMWYPPVRRTLVCLSRLYRCIDRPVFQGLSQEALSHCIHSVSAAAQQISTKQTPIDGELFEIKHLLILREQIAPFRVDFTVKETSLDFSKVKTAAFELIQKRGRLFSMGSSNSLLEFLLEGTPQVKEQMVDSRKDVDRQLKFVCEQFIKNVTKMFVGSVIQFIDNAHQLLKSSNSGTSPQGQQPSKVNYVLRQTPWAAPQQISSIIQESQRNIKSKLVGVQRSMQLYLANKDTEFILFRPIRNNIINAFVRLEQLLVTNCYSKDDLTICGCPSADQISVLLSNASLMADSQQQSAHRKISTSSTEPQRKISVEKKSVSFDQQQPGPSIDRQNSQINEERDDVFEPKQRSEPVQEKTT
uniref:Conserved oligomeric Golgi complex subunit 3 n=1 Tax=Culicoides sonorensis TaxID=179676 RepID=A0A336LNT1_CULSO